MAKLEGKDTNGMRPGPWGKLDTSAIEAPKLSSKATNEELSYAVRDMLAQAVDLLYGSSKDKKYVKIVDMLMLRVRGTLAKLNDSIEETAEEQSSKIETALDKLSSAFEEIVKKNAEEQSAKHEEQLKALCEAIVDEFELLKAEIAEDQTSSSASSASSASSSTQSNQPEPDNQQSSDHDAQSIAYDSDVTSLLNSTYDLAADMQKKVMDGFAKIQGMLKDGIVQKNVIKAMSSIQPPSANQSAGYVQRAQSSISSQTDALAQKIAAGVSSTSNAVDSSTRKQKKLSNVMTTKQFAKLDGMINRQFNDFSKDNQESQQLMASSFSKIDSKIDEYIKSQKKSKFPWATVLLFVTLFAVPFFWSKIKQFFNDFDKKYQISDRIKKFFSWAEDTMKLVSESIVFVSTKIKEFTADFDWEHPIESVGNKIWEFVKEKFSKFVNDPTESMQKTVLATYNEIKAWVKCLWARITGTDPDGKKLEAERRKAEEQQIAQSNARLENDIKSTEKKLEDKTKALGEEADTHSKTMTNDVTSAETTLTSNQNDLQSKTGQLGATLKQSDDELKQITKTAANDATEKVAGLKDDLTKTINKTTSSVAEDISKDANRLITKLKDEGAPSQFTEQQVNDVSLEIDQIPSTSQPDVKVLSPVKDYRFVHSTSDRSPKNLLVTKQLADEQLQKIERKSASSDRGNVVEQLREAAGLETGSSTAALNDGASISSASQDISLDSGSRLRKGSFVNSLLDSGTVSSQTTSESLSDRETRLYGNVERSFEAVLSHAADVKTGLQKNASTLNALKNEVTPVMNDIYEVLQSLKSIKPIVNNTALVSNASNGNDKLTSAMMKAGE